jgi:predicted ATPase
VTLTGVGGIGKTRISLQVATDLLGEFPDGVWFIELAPLKDPDLIPQSILSILGIAEQQGQTALEALNNAIRKKTLLIVLDNCEHLIEASARIVEALLNNAPGLIILASSREALGVNGELARYVTSLALPNINHLPKTQQLFHYEAVRLFVERVKLVQPHFLLTDDNVPTIAQICVRLDGIPLALELAAARIKSMSLEQIASRLDDRFRLLTMGSRTAFPRQQTLRATIDWSYNLLSESECTMLQQLSVFAGGWTLEAAEVVCSGDSFGKEHVLNVLTNLVNKSLVVFHPDEARYGMLETVKQYAHEKMGDRENDYFHAHMRCFLNMAEEAELYQGGEEQVKWLNRLEKEHDNFRVALERSLQKGVYDIALRIAGALGQFWWVHNHLKEGREWLRHTLRGSGEFNKLAQAKALFWAGTLARQQGDYEEAKQFTNKSLELCRTVEDREGMARALNSLGAIEYFEGDLAIAQRDFNDALALRRELKDMSGIANALNNLAIVVHTQGNLPEAAKLYEESLTICREIGEKWIMGHVLLNLGHIAYEQRNEEEAWRLYKEDLALCGDLGDREGMAFALSSLAQMLCNDVHAIRAAQIQGAVIATLTEVGASLEPIEQSYFDKSTLTLKHLLGEASYKKEFEEGKALLLDQAIELALKKEAS